MTTARQFVDLQSGEQIKGVRVCRDKTGLE